MHRPDIDIAIGIAKSIIALVELLDSTPEDNPVVKELNRLIGILESLVI